MTCYIDDSARPLSSLAFAFPILGLYEFGVLHYGPAAMRNGADLWLRRLLEQIGFGQYCLLPILTCGLLLGWHHLRREPWQIRSDTLGMMLTETTALALLIVLLGFLYMQVASQFGLIAASTTPRHSMNERGFGQVIGYVGAGIYEEVLFRLLIIPPIAAFLRYLGEPKSVSLLGAAMASSMLFAAAHYEVFTGMGEPFAAASFLFRWFAGLVFAAIFIFRGFGVAVGTHALYDLIAGYLNA